MPELEKFFNDHRVKGTFAPFDIATDTILVANGARAKERFIPASTFKIANSLIGLDTGAVKNVDEVLPYGFSIPSAKLIRGSAGSNGRIRLIYSP